MLARKLRSTLIAGETIEEFDEAVAAFFQAPEDRPASLDERRIFKTTFTASQGEYLLHVLWTEG